MRKQTMNPVNIELIKVSAVCLSLFCAGEAFPATVPNAPDAGFISNTVKPSPMPPAAKPTETLINVPEESRPAMKQNDNLRVVINHIRFSGVKAFPEKVLQDLVAGKIGKELNFVELTDIAGLVTKFYRDRGYLVGRAYLPEQPLTDNTIEIVMLEGKIGEVKPNFKTVGPKISDERLKSYINGALPTGSAITVPELERAMLFENALPNLKATATLVPGASVGTSDLVLEANQVGRFSNDTLELDNYGSRYMGSWRYGASANIASPLGLGDQLSARVMTSLEGFDYERLSWTTPVGGQGLKVGVATTLSNYTLGGPFVSSGLAGKSEVDSIFSVYPLIRTRYFNVYQTLTVESKKLYNFDFLNVLSDKRVHDYAIGLNGDDYDNWMGGGLSNFSATYTQGTVDLTNDPEDAANDAATINTAGNYSKILLQAMRQQHLSEHWVIYGMFTDQMTNKNLDSSETMAMGGPNSVRAYPVGEAPADQGTLTTVELRYNTVAPRDMGELQYQLFYDYGTVQLHHSEWSQFSISNIPNNYDLKGAGVGVNIYKENKYMASAALATKIGQNPNPGIGGADADGTHSQSRAWLQLTVYW